MLGRESFARISAVDGVELTAEVRETMERFDREGLSVAARHNAIRKWFAPGKHFQPVHVGALSGAIEDSDGDPHCYPGSRVLKNCLTFATKPISTPSRR